MEQAADLSLRILSQILLGVDVPAAISESIRLVLDARAVETTNAVSSGRRHTSSKYGEKTSALTHVHQFLSELIEQRRKEGEDRGDMLGVLVRTSQRELEDGVSRSSVDRRIRDETMSMINASLDATAAALAWTLLLVAKDVNTQQLVREEIEEAVRHRDDSETQFAQLPRAERVVFESLRLYPPNWVFITRRSSHSTQLGGYRIPRGTWLYIFPYVVHRDSRWFEEPESFVPDRFTSDAFGPMQRAAYIPLGLGPHVCNGKALSTIVLTSILACVLRDFRLGLAPGNAVVRPSVDMVMTPRAGTCLITKRLAKEEAASRN